MTNITIIKNAKSADLKQKAPLQPQKSMLWSLGIKKKRKRSKEISARTCITTVTKNGIILALTLIRQKTSCGLDNFNVIDPN